MDLWLLPSRPQVDALALDGFGRLARRADPITACAPGMDAALRAHCGWTAKIPWAALLAGEPTDSLTPWLAGDLVHLRAEQVSARVMALAVDRQRPDPDWPPLFGALRPWLADEAIEMVHEGHGRVLMRCPDSLGDPATLAPDALLGLDLRAALPADLRWQRRLNELQIVLTQQTLNAARAERGQPTWNMLWFWGQGSAAETPAPAFAAIASRDPQLQALARHWQRPLLAPAAVASGSVLRDLRDPGALASAWESGLRPRDALLRHADGSASRVRSIQRLRFWR